MVYDVLAVARVTFFTGWNVILFHSCHLMNGELIRFVTPSISSFPF